MDVRDIRERSEGMKYGESKNLVDSSEIYNANKDFVTLNAWKKAREVKLFFYNKIIPKLPREKKFNLDTQIRKAAVRYHR